MEELLELLQNKETISAMIDQYKDLVYFVAGELWKVYKDYVANDEYFDTCAKAQKKMFDAYQANGFSEEQAMQLLLNRNLEISKMCNSYNSSVSKTRK